MKKNVINNNKSEFQNRADFHVIVDWIVSGSAVLDLGCGNGELLEYLCRHKDAHGMGVDYNRDKIVNCIARGIPVIQQNLNEGIDNFKDNSFDFVVLSQTLQVLHHPKELLSDMLRVGKYGIVSFPNFGHYSIVFPLLFTGRMPKSKSLPYEWFDTPNIHQLTIKDFRQFCKMQGIAILKEYHIQRNSFTQSKFFANKFSEGCVCLIGKEPNLQL